jgi:hypothetical protein
VEAGQACTSDEPESPAVVVGAGALTGSADDSQAAAIATSERRKNSTAREQTARDIRGAREVSFSLPVMFSASVRREDFVRIVDGCCQNASPLFGASYLPARALLGEQRRPVEQVGRAYRIQGARSGSRRLEADALAAVGLLV